MSDYLFNKGKIKCEHCGPLPVSHRAKWVEDFLYFLTPARFIKINSRIENAALKIFEVPLFAIGILKYSDDLEHKDISFRSRVFIREATKRGIKIRAVQSSWGHINRFTMEKNGKKVNFEGLPTMDSFSKISFGAIDDKKYVKKFLLKKGLPAPVGKSFWFFQKKKAHKWAIKNIGFPLVVKPRLGSMSHHVATNVRNEKELDKAIVIAVKYGPTFIVEKYLVGASVYRANVVNFEKVACAKRIPAHIVGNGKNSIADLIAKKNAESGRGNAGDHDCTVFKVTFDAKSEELLKKEDLSLGSVPENGQIVYLQEKIILDLGADVEEVTGKIHSDNRDLFCSIAKAFDSRLVGIDFLASDISVSWKDQECAVIELNSLPYIDIHHSPSFGESVSVGGWLAEAVDKCYFGR